MRNKAFVDVLIADIGVCIDDETLQTKPKWLDVTTLTIFTSCLDLIRNKSIVCLDGNWINIPIFEEAMVTLKDSKTSSEDNCLSRDLEDFSSSEIEEKEDFDPLDNNREGNRNEADKNDEPYYRQECNRGHDGGRKNLESVEGIKCHKTNLVGTMLEEGSSDGGDIISSHSSSFATCSFNESFNNITFYDEVSRRVGPAGLFIKKSR